MKYSVIQFRLGDVVPEVIEDETSKFYDWLAACVAGGQTVTACESPFFTTPISNRETNDSNSFLLHKRVLDWHKKHKELAEIFIIDVNSSPGIFRAHLAHQLERAVQNLMGQGAPVTPATANPALVLLLPELPPPGEITVLHSLVEAGSVVLLGQNGAHHAGPRKLTGYSDEQLRIKLFTARGDLEERLSRKMIRRVGHFERSALENQQVCSRYFYDGRFCSDEIVKLLERELGTKTKPPRLLFYQCDASPWLMEPLLALQNRRSLQLINLGTDGRNPGRFRRTERNGPAMLLVDFVASGKTLRDLLQKIWQLGWRRDEVDVRAVMVTSPTDRQSKIREYQEADGELIQIRYFMEASEILTPAQDCVLHQLKQALTAPDVELYRMLTAYEHWTMALEAGTKPEDNPPVGREPFGEVINYPSMIEKYGAWLALKVGELLFRKPGSLPADAVIVCPEHEVGSQAFTDYLKFLLDFTVIRIPRKVIDEYRKDAVAAEAQTTAIKNEDPDWYRDLLTASPEIIVIDEFNASGGTFEGMKKLLNTFGKTVQCFLSLNDLNPKWSDAQSIPVYSLYRWQSYSRASGAMG